MACFCHGKNGENVSGKVAANDQCTTCALKHVEMAWLAWGEFLYEEANRRWCAIHLRLAVEHTLIDHKDFAIKCRDVAVIIENAMDKDRKDIKKRLDNLHDEILDLFKIDNPSYINRLEKLKDM